MTDAFNYHGLLQGTLDKVFIKQIDLDIETNLVLKNAVTKISNCLRPELTKLAKSNGVRAEYATPHFRLQGSTVYQTQNFPAHPSEQQVDADLGTYLSATFMHAAASSGDERSVPADELAKSYFKVVEHALEALCRKEGWKLIAGQGRKNNCCRIDLSSVGVCAHIDVPLYAAPDDNFKRALAMDSALMKAAARTDLAPELDAEGWDSLDVVVMATRDGGWHESDVQVVIRHFKAFVNKFGPAIVRHWRYVKAWRDFVWKKGGGPSSVLIMQCVALILDSTFGQEKLATGRDDVVLRFIFSELANKLANPVRVQWCSEVEDLNDVSPDERGNRAKLASRTYETLERAATDATLNMQEVISKIRECFGQRIPDDVKLVRFLLGTAMPTTAPKMQPSPQDRLHRSSGA